MPEVCQIWSDFVGNVEFCALGTAFIFVIGAKTTTTKINEID